MQHITPCTNHTRAHYRAKPIKPVQVAGCQNRSVSICQLVNYIDVCVCACVCDVAIVRTSVCHNQGALVTLTDRMQRAPQMKRLHIVSVCK